MTDILPCPFCGYPTITLECDTSQGSKWGRAECGYCGATGPEVRTGYDCGNDAEWHQEAIKEWSRRGGEDLRAAQDVIERLSRLATQRGARMQILHDAIIEAYSYEPDGPLHDVIARAAYWFDSDGVPTKEVEK